MNFSHTDVAPRASAGYRPRRLGAFPTVSIVVTSFGNARQAGDVVRALARQQRSVSTGVDLVLVRSGPDAELESLRQEHPGVRVVAAPPGATRAQYRTAGVLAADGDVVVITDDARVPPPDWLARVGRGTRRAPAARAPRPSPRGNRPPAIPHPS